MLSEDVEQQGNDFTPKVGYLEFRNQCILMRDCLEVDLDITREQKNERHARQLSLSNTTPR